MDGFYFLLNSVIHRHIRKRSRHTLSVVGQSIPFRLKRIFLICIIFIIYSKIQWFIYKKSIIKIYNNADLKFRL